MLSARYRLTTRLSSDELRALNTLSASSRRDVQNQAAVTIVGQLRRLGHYPIGDGKYDPDLLYPVLQNFEGGKDLRLLSFKLNRDEYIALVMCAKENNSDIRTMARELIQQGLEFHSLLPEKAA